MDYPVNLIRSPVIPLLFMRLDSALRRKLFRRSLFILLRILSFLPFLGDYKKNMNVSCSAIMFL